MLKVVAAVQRGDAYYDQVLETAGRLAGDGHPTVISIHPRPIDWVSDPVHSLESRTADERRDLARQIESDAARLGVGGGEVVVPLAQRANVADDIVEQAQTLAAAVLVVGTHGRKGLDAWVVGSVAERVVRRASCDVHIVRNRERDEEGEGVLAVVVPGDASYPAVLRAAEWLSDGRPLEVLSLYPPPPARESTGFRSPAEQTGKARDALEARIAAELAERSIRATVSVPLATLNDLGENLVALAEERGAGVLVTGTHGRKGLRRFFMGSVAEHLVRHAHCDVHVAR